MGRLAAGSVAIAAAFAAFRCSCWSVAKIGAPPKGCRRPRRRSQPLPPAPRRRPAAVPAADRPRSAVLITIDTLRADALGTYRTPPQPVAPHRRDRRPGGAVRAVQRGVPDDAALPCVDPDRKAPLPARHPGQRPLRPRPGQRHPGRAAARRRLRHRGRGGGRRAGEADPDRPGVRPLPRPASAGTVPPVRATPRASAAPPITRDGIEFLRSHAGRPFFLWLHYFDAHAPYEPPEPHATAFRDSPYHGEVAAVDAQIGRSAEALGQLGLADDTLVILTSDHGEGLGDHGEESHLFWITRAPSGCRCCCWGPPSWRPADAWKPSCAASTSHPPCSTGSVAPLPRRRRRVAAAPGPGSPGFQRPPRLRRVGGG